MRNTAMLAPLQTPDSASRLAKTGSRRHGRLVARGVAAFDWMVGRKPFVCLFAVLLLSNALGSFFNLTYNNELIVARYLDETQQRVFTHVALPVYNAVAYPVGIGITIYLLVPLSRCRKRLRAGQSVPPAELELARMRLVNLPFYLVCINSLCWLPGAVIFPLLITTLGGPHMATAIWVQFILSFFASASLTTAQTFFLLEVFLMRYFYPDFFQDARPADIRGVVRIRIGTRLCMMGSTMVVPLLALLLVALNFDASRAEDYGKLHFIAIGVTLIGALSGSFVFWLVGSDISRWVTTHARATEQIELENYDVHIEQKRPDEFGRLNDSFNDMAGALARARQMRETFGQFVGPEERDDILQNYPGLEGEEQEVTVLFADIRGFTRRTAGESPRRVVELLNRFLTLAVTAIRNRGGRGVKFLGDGVMALFGVRGMRANHADQGIGAARDLVAQLAHLNAELAAGGEPPLCIGIGIHTGKALVGCIGARIVLPDGKEWMRREFTAIGETVNLAQRVEQLTKSCPGPILISESTRLKMSEPHALHSYGAVPVPGFDGTLAVHKVEAG
jgi:adenylate cyclase